MNHESPAASSGNLEHIPGKERTQFQLALIESMLGEKLETGNQEQESKVMDWINHYAQKTADIIDNPNNKEIRELIMSGDYNEASTILMKALLEEKTDLAA
jgi:hypothetical protein